MITLSLVSVTIESLAYIMLHLTAGYLPWSSVFEDEDNPEQADDETADLKEDISCPVLATPSRTKGSRTDISLEPEVHPLTLHCSLFSASLLIMCD